MAAEASRSQHVLSHGSTGSTTPKQAIVLSVGRATGRTARLPVRTPTPSIPGATTHVNRRQPESASGLRIVRSEDVRPFENCVPLFDLKVAAGMFSDSQAVGDRPQAEVTRNPDGYTWVALPASIKPAPDLFVAQVVGESMNRRIANGGLRRFPESTSRVERGQGRPGPAPERRRPRSWRALHGEGVPQRKDSERGRILEALQGDPAARLHGSVPQADRPRERF